MSSVRSYFSNRIRPLLHDPRVATNDLKTFSFKEKTLRQRKRLFKERNSNGCSLRCQLPSSVCLVSGCAITTTSFNFNSDPSRFSTLHFEFQLNFLKFLMRVLLSFNPTLVHFLWGTVESMAGWGICPGSMQPTNPVRLQRPIKTAIYLT